MASKPLADRLWARVDVRDPDSCWLWQGSQKPPPENYGQMFGYWDSTAKKRVVLYVHRVAYEVTFGAIPNGLLVLHHCDTPPCCNPCHLYLGTDADNGSDKAKRDRAFRHIGSLNGRAKLSTEDVQMIRALHERGATKTDLARVFKVSDVTIGKIAMGRLWREPASPPPP